MDLSYPYEVTDKKERAYIRKRKRAAFLHSLCFYVCRLFPIKKNLVSVCTFEGRGGFGCNPKYVVQELHKRNPDYDLVWFVKDIKKNFPDYIREVPNPLWSRAYWLSRSKVWIDNYRKPLGTKKRKAQYYLNTNHYTLGIKTVGLWRGKGFSKMAYLVSKNDSEMIDDLIIDSKFCEEMCPKGLIYSGSYLKTGAPRCDVLYGNREKYKNAFREKYGLGEDTKVVMFAPTFREGAKNGVRMVYSQIWTIDFAKLIQCLEERFGGTWYICVRVHPQLAEQFHGYTDEHLQKRIINESQSDDMYEILAAMDAYITDYSSAVFEACYCNMPAFLYVDDLTEYRDSRNLFWNLSNNEIEHVSNNKKITPGIDVELPFDIARNNEELKKCILQFDKTRYIDNVMKFKRNIRLVFNGDASGEVANVIIKKMSRK